MTILITGATGLVGSKLLAHLQARGHDVRFLTTSRDKIGAVPLAKGFYWNPEKGELDPAALADVETIVHLAGATIAKRWTPSYKDEIIRSRVSSAQLLYAEASRRGNTLKHFISASGIGIYPDNFSEHYDESFTGKPRSFPGRVVREWEKSADAFALLGLPVAKVRTGLVLASNGGALPQLVKPIKMGLGAPLGDGRQIVSWIHLDDLIKIYTLIIEKQLTGIYNAVAPNPVSQAQLTREIAKILGKPLWLPKVPPLLLKIALGEMSTLMLEGQYVESRRIASKGMQFAYPEINGALRDLLA